MRRVEHARALIRAGISPGRFRALLKILRAWRSQVIGPTEPRLSVDRYKVRLTLPSGCHEPVDSDGMERHEGGDDGTEPRLSRWLDAREDRVSASCRENRKQAVRALARRCQLNAWQMVQ